MDPVSPFPFNAKGLVLVFSKRYDEAAQAFSRVLEIDPVFLLAHQGLGLALERIDDCDAAIEEFKLARGGVDPSATLAHLEYVYGLTGQTDVARRVLGVLN
ncbi:MAG TPA: tetratricopeptide repeat protein [Blastocatellia bacterium]|nr:tetratricopeptide repeat protein [Blastocatellia bacterium]